MKKHLTKLLRNDLDLNKKWWHRLLSVLFVLLFIITTTLTALDLYGNDKIIKYKETDILSERVAETYKHIKYLVNTEDKEIIYNNKIGYISDQGSISALDYYCSSDISKNIEKIEQDLNINSYVFGDTSVGIKEFKEGLYQHKAKCVKLSVLNIVDKKHSISDYDWNKSSTPVINSDKIIKTENILFYNSEVKDLNIYKISILNTTINILLPFIVIIISFIFILIFYYKVVLYIAFGSKKSVQ